MSEKKIEERIKYIGILLGLDPLILLEINTFLKNNDKEFWDYYSTNEKKIKKKHPNANNNELLYIAFQKFKTN